MNIKKIKAYKLKGERNITARKPLLFNDRLYVTFIFDKKGGIASKVVCLDKYSFEVCWEYDYPFVINNILPVSTNRLLVCCMDGWLNELDSLNGEFMNQWAIGLERCGHSSQIVGDKIIVGGVQRTKSTICFDLSKHTPLWSFNNGGHSYTPLIVEDKVYQCTKNKISCLTLSSGNLLWETFEKDSYLFNPIAADGMIAVGGSGLVNIYDQKRGRRLYQIKTGIRDPIRTLIYEDGCLYFGDRSGVFYAYRLIQRKNFFGRLKLEVTCLWHFKSNGGIESTPLIKKEALLFANNDKQLICLQKHAGQLLSTFNTKGAAGISGVILDDEDIYLSVGKGYVFKLRS